MGFLIRENEFVDNTKSTLKTAANKSASYFKAHWIDYLILFFICLLLGAFDIFILKKSDNFASLNYWLHSATRLGAYTLACVLGIRIGYPRIKAACSDYQRAIAWNIRLSKLRGTNFGDFINKINLETKKAAWKSYINRKLARLDKFSPEFFPIYYDTKDDSGKRSDEYFDRIKFNWLRKKIKNKAQNYCRKRENLEKFLSDEYIDKNIHSLSVKYVVVYKHDFDNVESGYELYHAYHTRTSTGKAKARAVVTGLLFTVVLIFLIGAVKLDIDEALLEQRVIGIIAAIINSIIDIGLTLWKFCNGLNSCEKIVRQEDLRAVVDKNELLKLYCAENGLSYPPEPDNI